MRRAGTKVTAYLPGGQELTLDTTTGTLAGLRYCSFAGQTIAVRNGAGMGAVTCLVPDSQGTALASIAPSSDTLTRRYADPFGAPRGASPTSWVGDRGFLNEVTDAATGLTQVGARYLDTLLGRFISVDPVMDLADPQQWNAFAYANNNPTTMTDPTGLLPKWMDAARSKASGGLSAANKWVKRNQATIVGMTVGFVAGTACGIFTVGAGAVVCGMAAGALSGAVSNLWASKVQHTTKFSAKSLALDVGLGLASGAAGAVVGRGLAALAPKLSGGAPALTGQLPAKVIGAATGGAKAAGAATGGAKAASSTAASANVAAESGAPLIKVGAAGGETAGRAFPQSIRQQALAENPRTCVYCRMETQTPQVDHVIPRATGGNALPNAQTTCPWCNASKSAREFPVNPPSGYRGAWPPEWWGGS